MENGGIPDARITASSFYQANEILPPRAGRLNKPASAWCSQSNQPGEWLKVDLTQKMIVTKIATQGKPVNNMQWVTSYKVSFSQDGRAWEVYKEHGVEKVKWLSYLECNTYCVSQHKSYLRMRFPLSCTFFLIHRLHFCTSVCSVCDHFLLSFSLLV